MRCYQRKNSLSLKHQPNCNLKQWISKPCQGGVGSHQIRKEKTPKWDFARTVSIDCKGRCYDLYPPWRLGQEVQRLSPLHKLMDEDVWKSQWGLRPASKKVQQVPNFYPLNGLHCSQIRHHNSFGPFGFWMVFFGVPQDAQAFCCNLVGDSVQALVPHAAFAPAYVIGWIEEQNFEIQLLSMESLSWAYLDLYPGSG